MTLKRRQRLTTDKNFVMDKKVKDSFTNFNSKLGLGADNQLSGSYYSLNNMISRNHVELEACYRSSWLVGAAVDYIAEDMTKCGVTFQTEMEPDEVQKMQVSISQHAIWECFCDTIKWARLYGGSIGVILIDGAKYDTPLDIEKIGKDTFQGILVLDRWMVQPSFDRLIKEMGKDLGMPEFYQVIPAATGIPLLKVHHSRVFRFDGIKLPYYQKVAENLWGLSVVERMLDRLMAYDSASLGAAQLIYKAYLRVIQVEGFRDALSTGGKDEQAVIKQFQYMRQMQSIEGITLLDAKDTFATHVYNFSGVSDLLIQFGQQISGATEIPLVRLFGQSPAGLSSTGEADLRNYYDAINKKQENQLRPKLDKLFKIISMSILGKPLPEDFEFTFNPLWQMSDSEKATITTTDTTSISNAFGAGLISKEVALKELLQQSRLTGRFTNITEEDIDKAREEDANKVPPSMPEEKPLEGKAPELQEEQPEPEEVPKEESLSEEMKTLEMEKNEAKDEYGVLTNEGGSFKEKEDKLKQW